LYCREIVLDSLFVVKQIAILGSTGSIGRNAVAVIDALGPDYQVFALTAHSNVRLLAEQARRYRPRFVAVTDSGCAPELGELLADLDVEILAGPDALTTIAELDQVDGELLTKEIHKNGGAILPVDSEHSAVFQAMQSGRPEEVKRIILTGSGGPFRGATAEDLQEVTLEQALSHPTWDMGPKITVDSATMMNKAFEIIEARWLFDIPVEKVEVLIHPESIVHSLVEFVDGSTIAQLGEPDMCLPIQYALTYPARVAGITRELRLEETGKLTFAKPDFEMFRALPLAYEVAGTGGTAPVVFNAANEAAVEEFLAGRITFVNIVEFIEHCLDKHSIKTEVSLEELLEVDDWARREVTELACSV